MIPKGDIGYEQKINGRASPLGTCTILFLRIVVPGFAQGFASATLNPVKDMADPPPPHTRPNLNTLT